MIALDKVHIYAQHGRSFHTSIWILQRVFFAIIFAACADYTLLLLAMTDTMPQTLLQSLSDLTHIYFTDKRHQLWSTPNDFDQRYIEMDMHVLGEIKVKAFPPLVKVLVDKRGKCLYFYLPQHMHVHFYVALIEVVWGGP